MRALRAPGDDAGELARHAGDGNRRAGHALMTHSLSISGNKLSNILDLLVAPIARMMTGIQGDRGGRYEAAMYAPLLLPGLHP
jgi:prophage maintenance system killer protein